MSQIKIKAYFALMASAILLMSAAGCGSSKTNPESAFSADSQKHGATWLPAEHKAAARENIENCTECHGTDLSGGISGVSCSKCHLGGSNSVHPVLWSGLTATSHGSYAKASGNTSCANAACHGTDLGGVAESGPSCSSCHLGGPTSVHPLDWAGSALVTAHGAYVSAARSFASCATAVCHGTRLEGVAGSGHACSRCH